MAADDLARQFANMHIGVQHSDEKHCREVFFNKLKKATGKSRIRRRSYVDVCSSSSTRKCKYVMRVFDHDTKGKILFQHELTVLKDLASKHVDFIPKIREAFTCSPSKGVTYGLLVMEKWDGDILDLLFRQQDHNVEATFQTAYHLAKVAMGELHKAGWCYGANSIDFRHLIFCASRQCPDVLKTEHGFHIGFLDWKKARPKTPSGEESDMNKLDLLFMEISHTIRALRHRHPIPEHVPAGMFAKAQSLRQGL